MDEKNAQVILVSLHPEVLDQLADQGGVVLDRLAGGETRVLSVEPPADSGLEACEFIARGWELPSDLELKNRSLHIAYDWKRAGLAP